MTQSNFNKAVAFIAEAAWRKAEKHYARSFTRWPIEWAFKGRTAGTAHLDEQRITLSVEIAMQNQVRFLGRTVPHEIAHAIEWQLWRTAGHGERWQSIMAALGVADNSPTHDYDVSSVRPKKITSRWQYKLSNFQ